MRAAACAVRLACVGASCAYRWQAGTVCTGLLLILLSSCSLAVSPPVFQHLPTPDVLPFLPNLPPRCLFSHTRLNSLQPIIMSAGELENEWAGTPGKLIRERYR